MSKRDMNVIIMHGHSEAWQKIQVLIDGLGYTSRVLKEEFGGEVIFNKLRDVVWDDIHCAIIIMSADDITNQNKFRATQNVIFELGYCYGVFDSMPEEEGYNGVIILKEDIVEIFVDIAGLEYIEYKKRNLRAAYPKIESALKNIYRKASTYFGI
jgi:predicted nucleotide-binding protein